MQYLDFYMGPHARIIYNKDLSLTQYSTTYTVRLHTKNAYDIVNMNIITGTGINVIKKNLVCEIHKDDDGNFVYSYNLGLDATGYEFNGEKSIIKLTFYLYPDSSDQSMVTTSNTCYLSLLAAAEDVPSDASISESDKQIINSRLNELGELLAELDVGRINTAIYYEDENGQRYRLSTVLDKLRDDIDDTSADLVNLSSNLSTTKDDLVLLKSRVSSLEDRTATFVTTTALAALNYASVKYVNDKIKELGDSVNGDLTGYVTTDELKKTIDDLIGGAPETLDTLKEIADALANNESVIAAINSAISTKADASNVYTKAEVESLIANADISSKLVNYYTKAQSDNLYATKTELTSKQDKLTSGTNIKTINNETILTSGNIDIPSVEVNKDEFDDQLPALDTLTVDGQAYKAFDTYIGLSDRKNANGTKLRSLYVGDEIWSIEGGTADTSGLEASISDLQTQVDEVSQVASEALVRASNATSAKVFDTYAELDRYLRTQPETFLPLGTDLYTRDESPDYWISSVYETPVNGYYYGITESSGITNLEGYATEQWVENKGYLTQHQDISGKESIENKVTTIGDNPNNYQYPSANAVKTYVDGQLRSLGDEVQNTFATKEALSEKVNTTTYEAKVEQLQGAITENASGISNLETGISELDNRLDTVESNIGTGGTIDTRIQAAVSGANSYTDTKVNDEKTARETADNNLSSRLSTIEGDYLTSSDVVGNNGEAVGETLTSLKIGNKNYNVEVLGAEFVFSNEALSGAQDLRTLVVNGDRWNFKVDPAEFNEFKQSVLADIEAYKAELKAYADQKVADIVGQAPEAYDTLKEISDYISEDTTNAASMLASIQENTTAITTKANIGDSYTKAESDGKYQLSTTAYNKSNIVYSETEPANPVEGMIWLKNV